ncbi:response regulator [Photobacterium sp. SDRW27]|uniref:response regulator n=1 Tax=Photobacterium obscurum TaxID=2829490 RepID=UPI002242E057|nr:response regulator [Photobacterium obscurum]MCW8331589.1 response regulator [Photobacterium obscurum]
MTTSQSNAQQSVETDFSKLKLLIVDDQRSAALMFKSLLHSLDVEKIDLSFNYQSAIESCQKNHYDILLIDYHLDGTLNGCELTALLRKRGYISAECGVIMISGDTSTEVILTSMTVEPDSFITKPVALSVIKKKLEEVHTACMQRKPIYDALELKGIPAAIELCKKQLRKLGHNHKIEGLLLDLLIEINEWEQVERFTAILKKENPSHKVSLCEARLLHHKGKLPEAIALLQHLIKRSPLNIESYDYLSNYQEENKQYYDALNTAEKALHFTPSVSHRALTVAQLAADLDKSENLIAAGKLLAAKLPIIDISWIIRFAEFTAIFEQLYFTQRSNNARRQLKQELKAIHQRARSRLLPNQQPFLDCLGHITQARLLLALNQPLKAKRRVMLGLAPHFDTISKLPSVVLADALPALIHLGETRIIADIYRALKLRNRFDGHSQNRLDALVTNEALLQSLKNLENTLVHCVELSNGQPEQALTLYEQILIDYPYCTEAHLGRLQCQNLLNQFDEGKTRQSLQAIVAMPLPDKLATWRNKVLTQIASSKASLCQVRIALSYKNKLNRYVLVQKPSALAS